MPQGQDTAELLLALLGGGIIKIRAEKDKVGGLDAPFRLQLRQAFRLLQTGVDIMTEDDAAVCLP